MSKNAGRTHNNVEQGVGIYIIKMIETYLPKQKCLKDTTLKSNPETKFFQYINVVKMS